MSFSKPKAPVMPSFAQQQAEQEAYAKSKADEVAAVSDRDSRDNLRLRQKADTRVGGRAIAAEEQEGKGLINQMRRKSVYGDLN